MARAPIAVSIYAGGGGLDHGFRAAGFRVPLATDMWDVACETLRRNAPRTTRVICADIRDVDFGGHSDVIPPDRQVDCLIGGPPCPAYSKSRFYRKEKPRALQDENAFTLAEFFRALAELKPKTFVFENVHGFVYRPHKEAFAYLARRCKELGYTISPSVICAADYGVPQIRVRFFCVGVQEGRPRFEFPTTTHRDPRREDGLLDGDLPPWVTCGDVLDDLDHSLPEDASMRAGSRHHDLLRMVPPGDNYLFFTEERGHPEPKFKWRSRYWSFLLKLSPEKPSWTIQASHSNNMGPFHWRNRFLRISELKRLQTFDDSYDIAGSYREQWRQVGNAVPPLLARLLAAQVRRQCLTQAARV